MAEPLIRVWDLPTRVFHWALAVAVPVSLTTGMLGGEWMVWHGRCGFFVLALLAFRLAWGLFGSTYARFTVILAAIPAVPRYLRGDWQGAGHNPLGALSVLTMLAILSLQVTLGLFANDHHDFSGPLRRLVSADVSLALSEWHEFGALLVTLLVLLHLAAVFWHVCLRHRDLLRPMITGDAVREHAGQQPARGGGRRALIMSLLFALSALLLASGFWLPAAIPVQGA